MPKLRRVIRPAGHACIDATHKRFAAALRNMLSRVFSAAMAFRPQWWPFSRPTRALTRRWLSSASYGLRRGSTKVGCPWRVTTRALLQPGGDRTSGPSGRARASRSPYPAADHARGLCHSSGVTTTHGQVSLAALAHLHAAARAPAFEARIVVGRARSGVFSAGHGRTLRRPVQPSVALVRLGRTIWAQ